MYGQHKSILFSDICNDDVSFWKFHHNARRGPYTQNMIALDRRHVLYIIQQTFTLYVLFSQWGTCFCVCGRRRLHKLGIGSAVVFVNPIIPSTLRLPNRNALTQLLSLERNQYNPTYEILAFLEKAYKIQVLSSVSMFLPSNFFGPMRNSKNKKCLC